jgi:hypothetical protein
MRRLTIGTVLALATAVALGSVALAAEMEEMAPHPAHIHAGVCPEPGDVVAPLNDVTAGMGEAAGVATAVPTVSSFSVVELALADILAGEHSINVHLSADDLGTYLACGDIGGVPVDTGMGQGLAVGMAPVGESDLTGVALLLEMPDGNTGVDVLLFHQSALP